MQITISKQKVGTAIETKRRKGDDPRGRPWIGRETSTIPFVLERVGRLVNGRGRLNLRGTGKGPVMGEGSNDGPRAIEGGVAVPYSRPVTVGPQDALVRRPERKDKVLVWTRVFPI